MSMTRYHRTRVQALSFFALALPLFACGDNIVPTVPIECGNGIVQEGEACDDGAASPYCNDDCTLAMCGDGKVSLDEECDSGNESATCNADCTAAVCGDGLVNAAAGEECDGDGAGTPGVTANCNFDCTATTCGDGIVNMLAGEECDGDGAGNGGETAACNSDCTFNFCGDGVVNLTAGEICDGADTGGAMCSDIGTFDSGTLGCNATCDAFDTAGCGECGNNVLDGAEQCDAADFGAATCGDFPPLDNGVLACNADCTIDTAGCGDCGNGVVDGSEDCEGTDVGGALCTDIPPYTGGTLGCDAAVCSYDVSQCFSTESVQNDDGVCVEEIGCSNGDGTSGNPNEIVECFTSTLTPPFALNEVSYEVGVNPGAPVELFVEVYEWTGTGLPGVVADSAALPAGELTPGTHTVVLATPLTVTTQAFCIGINGYDATDGYRLMKSQTTSVAGSSFIRAPTCGANDFVSMADIGFPGNWCIRGVIGGITP